MDIDKPNHFTEEWFDAFDQHYEDYIRLFICRFGFLTIHVVRDDIEQILI